MEKRNMLREGNAKMVYATDADDLLIVEYKGGDSLDKGAVNNRVTNHLMRMLEAKGVPTHYVSELSDRETLVKKAEIVKIEVIVRNIAAGSLSKRLGLAEGTKLPCTVLEYRLKNGGLGNPIINRYHAFAMGLATSEELDSIDCYSFLINDALREYLASAGVDLVDFKLEFGRLLDGSIVLADEISPDTCRLWDIKTGEKPDKDRFRRSLGGENEAYREILSRLLED